MTMMLTYSSGVTAPVSPLPVRRFTVAEYHKMIADGILGESEPVELLEGWVVPKISRNTPHDVSLDLAGDALRAVLPATWRVRTQLAITLSTSEPEPDIAVVLNPARRYAQRHPTPPEIALVVEVAESSLQHDRTTKARVYARDGIPVYWILNVIDKQIEVFTNPSGDVPNPGYGVRQDYALGSTVPVVIAGAVVGQLAVDDLIV
jgi:Putative restriction endonuclease